MVQHPPGAYAPSLTGAPFILGYSMIGELGRGGMGVVYRATEQSSGRTVAIKVLPVTAPSGARARFAQEAALVQILDHPDIIKTFGSGENDHFSWVVMEYLDGFELSDAMQDRSFPIEDRIHILRRVALALHYAHGMSIVHRDVKPPNIFLTRDGGVRLLDFGVAKFHQIRLTKTGMTAGTPAYMAPEQIRGHGVDARADVFALGVVAYEVLTGTLPWVADHPSALMMATLTTPPRPFREAFLEKGWFTLDAARLSALHKTIHTALSLEPTRRFQSAAEMAAALESYLSMPAASEAPSEPERPVTNEDREAWANRRIEWAQARAARLRVESGAKGGAEALAAIAPAAAPADPVAPPPAVLGAVEHEAPDRSIVVWAALAAFFGAGLVAALVLAMK